MFPLEFRRRKLPARRAYVLQLDVDAVQVDLDRKDL
jgi:hypothetical protein